MTQPSSLPVSYSYGGSQYSYLLELTITTPHYGGLRYWWLCPKCSKRVSILYCAGIYVCRHCIGANYQSQLQKPIDGISDRLSAIRQRLGWQAGIINGIESKPLGMHHRTFNQLMIEHDRLTAKLMELMI